MNTTIEKNLQSKLNKIKAEAEDVKEAMENLIKRIDASGTSVGIGNELNTTLQKLIIEFNTMRDIYREQE